MRNIFLTILCVMFAAALSACHCRGGRNVEPAPNPISPTAFTNEEKAVAVMKSLESGDPTAVEQYVSEVKYIQHNPGFPGGRDALLHAINDGTLKGTTVDIVRSFSDGDCVVLHSDYFIFGAKQVGFDVFRFEKGLIVEHWDNLLAVQPPNASGRTQLDGETDLTDPDKTEENKALVKSFYDVVILGGQFERMGEFFDGDTYIQHNPLLPDGVSGFLNGVKGMQEKGIEMRLENLHMLLGQGNFVLGVAEGTFSGKPYAFYDLFRIEDGKLAEHWDIMAEIPPKDQWANSNGKF